MYLPSDNFLFTYDSHSNSLQAICLWFFLVTSSTDVIICVRRDSKLLVDTEVAREEIVWSRKVPAREVGWLPLPIPRDPRRENVAPDVSHGICCQLKQLFQIQNTVWSNICKGFIFLSFVPRRFDSNNMDFIFKI